MALRRVDGLDTCQPGARGPRQVALAPDQADVPADHGGDQGAAHSAGVTKARQFGEVQAVVASLVIVIASAFNVLLAPWVRQIFF